MNVLAIILAGILSENYAFLKLLGTGAVIDKAYSPKKSLLLGAGTTLIMVICTAITWLLNTYVLASYTYLQTMAFVVVLLVVVQVLYMVSKMVCKCSNTDFAKLAVSGAVLGLCVQNTAVELTTAVLTAAATGIGYMLTMTLYGKLRGDVVDEEAVHSAFRGLPISLLTAGMIVLAMLALQFKF